MGRLVHSVIASLDGYTADADGGFDWAMPSPQVEEHFARQAEALTTILYGRRMYETMAVWDDDAALAEALGTPGPADSHFAQAWRATPKVVFSRTLDAVWTSRTRLEHTFDPASVAALVAASDGDVSVEGSTLAVEAMRAGIVDVVEVTVVPVVIGGGTPYLPSGVRIDLELTGTTRFDNAMVQLRYAVRR